MPVQMSLIILYKINVMFCFSTIKAINTEMHVSSLLSNINHAENFCYQSHLNSGFEYFFANHIFYLLSLCITHELQNL